MQVVVLLFFALFWVWGCLIYFLSNVFYLDTLETPSDIVAPFAFCFQTYF